MWRMFTTGSLIINSSFLFVVCLQPVSSSGLLWKNLSRPQKLTWWWSVIITDIQDAQNYRNKTKPELPFNSTSFKVIQHSLRDQGHLSVQATGLLQPPQRNISSGFSVAFCPPDSRDKMGCFPVYISLLRNPWSPLICQIASDATLPHKPVHRNATARNNSQMRTHAGWHTHGLIGKVNQICCREEMVLRYISDTRYVKTA